MENSKKSVHKEHESLKFSGLSKCEDSDDSSSSEEQCVLPVIFGPTKRKTEAGRFMDQHNFKSKKSADFSLEVLFESRGKKTMMLGKNKSKGLIKSQLS